MPTPTITAPGLTPSQVNYDDVAQWKQIIKQALADTRCAMPAFLAEDINATAQTVTVQVAVQERVRVADGQAWWDIPPIVNVPVVLPRGGGFSLTLPLKKGDEGLLVFCDMCFDNWWLNGQNNAPPAQNPPPWPHPVPSGSQRQFEVRRHWVHDCGFIPGMWSQPNVLSDYATDSLQIRSDNGGTVIGVAESGVTITGAAVSVADGGTALALVNDTFYQWFVTEVVPFLTSEGFTGTVPAGSETTILKGQ